MINQDLMVATVVGMFNNLFRERDTARAKLAEARDRVYELEVALETARNQISELERRLIEAIPYPTTEEAHDILREYGYDPEQVGKRGRELANKALDEARRKMSSENKPTVITAEEFMDVESGFGNKPSHKESEG